MDDVTVHVEVEINPTETEDKVKQAVENMFGPMGDSFGSVAKETWPA